MSILQQQIWQTAAQFDRRQPYTFAGNRLTEHSTPNFFL
jgi:hypothetical protein